MTETSEPWRGRLILTDSGKPRPLLANAITALREAPCWQCVLAHQSLHHSDHGPVSATLRQSDYREPAVMRILGHH